MFAIKVEELDGSFEGWVPDYVSGTFPKLKANVYDGIEDWDYDLLFEVMQEELVTKASQAKKFDTQEEAEKFSYKVLDWADDFNGILVYARIIDMDTMEEVACNSYT